MINVSLKARLISKLAEIYESPTLLERWFEDVPTTEMMLVYAKSYEEIREEFPDHAAVSLQHFLELSLRHPEKLPPSVIAPWLQPRTEGMFLRDLSELVERRDLPASEISGEAMIRFSLQWRRIKAVNQRRSGEHDAANSAITKLKQEWRQVSPQTTDAARELATLCYEEAYISFLSNRIGDAVTCFSESVRHATAAGDRIAAEISNSSANRMRYLMREISLKEARQNHLDSFTALQDCAAESSLAADWTSNVAYYLLDVLTELGAYEEALQWKDYCRDRLRVSHSINIAFYESVFARIDGELKMIQPRPDFAGALRSFARIIQFQLAGFREPEQDLVKANRDMARTMRDAGRCLMALTQIDEAIKVWEAALALPPFMGNVYIQDDIRCLLANVHGKA
ncbi:MAG: hypothetical protein KDA89_22890 [Planctomycetaceae bacterium]|nr:hypothetical protein [Planctomycetaceae bacterium]